MGFPTESEEDFREMLKLLEDVEFDDIVVFRYSRVPGTSTYHMKGQIEEGIKAERERILLEKLKETRKGKRKYWGSAIYE